MTRATTGRHALRDGHRHPHRALGGAPQSAPPLDALTTKEGPTSASSPVTWAGSRTSRGYQATSAAVPGRVAYVAAVSCPAAVARRANWVPRNPLPPMIRIFMA